MERGAFGSDSETFKVQLSEARAFISTSLVVGADVLALTDAAAARQLWKRRSSSDRFRPRMLF